MRKRSRSAVVQVKSALRNQSRIRLIIYYYHPPLTTLASMC